LDAGVLARDALVAAIAFLDQIMAQNATGVPRVATMLSAIIVMLKFHGVEGDLALAIARFACAPSSAAQWQATWSEALELEPRLLVHYRPAAPTPLDLIAAFSSVVEVAAGGTASLMDLGGPVPEFVAFAEDLVLLGVVYAPAQMHEVDPIALVFAAVHVAAARSLPSSEITPALTEAWRRVVGGETPPVERIKTLLAGLWSQRCFGGIAMRAWAECVSAQKPGSPSAPSHTDGKIACAVSAGVPRGEVAEAAPSNAVAVTIPIARRWWQLIASGEKTVEFREASAYWRKRLLGRPDGWRVCIRNGYGVRRPSIVCEVSRVEVFRVDAIPVGMAPAPGTPDHARMFHGVDMVIGLHLVVLSVANSALELAARHPAPTSIADRPSPAPTMPSSKRRRYDEAPGRCYFGCATSSAKDKAGRMKFTLDPANPGRRLCHRHYQRARAALQPAAA